MLTRLCSQKWKTVYVVLRSNTLSVYKNEKETKLRHQVYLSDLTAVAFLKDPKHKRQNVFGLFSPSRNFHFQAPTAKDGQEWVDLIRKDAGVDDDDEVFLASPLARSLSPNELVAAGPSLPGHEYSGFDGDHIMLSSSPEPNGPLGPFFAAAGLRESFNNVDWSGNELPSHSDLSDNEGPRPLGASLESLTIQPQAEASSLPRGGVMASRPPVNRSLSQASILNDKSKKGDKNGNVDADLDRVIWHGWLWMLRSKGGVRQWKNMWAVLRPRNLILYKDESEYAVQWLVQLSAVVNVVDIDPLSKSKENCLQIITEEKSYRFCAREEESLVQFIGAFKSLLAKRRGLDGRGAPLPRATPSRLDDQARGQTKTE